MRSEWSRVLLGDVVSEVTVGFVGSMASEYVDVGVPFLRSQNVLPFRLSFNNLKYISPDFHSKLKKSALKPGDVVTVRTGKPGSTAVIPESLVAANCSDLVITRPGNAVDSRWLCYYINGAAAGFVSSRLVGAVQQHFNVSAAKEMELLLPPLDEQRAIAATLGTLDDKIESNLRLRDVALDLARAVLSTGTAHIRVGDTAKISKGLSYKGSGLSDGLSAAAIPMLNLGNFSTSGTLKTDGLKHYVGDFQPKHRLAPWDLVVANTDLTQRREILGRGFLVPFSLDGALHTHHTTRVQFMDQPELAIALWAQLQSPEFRDRAQSYAMGTTVASLPADAILDFEFTVPAELESALARGRSLIEYGWHLEGESVRLAAVRDALLPDLLSGRVRAPIEEMVTI